MKIGSIVAFKWLSVMLAVLVVAAAIGCGKKGAEQATPAPTATSSPTATATAGPTGLTGTLSDIEGDVQVQRAGAGEWTSAADGMKVGEGDGLSTGSDGYVLITFFDGSVMEVEADTEISIEELSQAVGGSTTVRINQSIGNTLNRVQNLVDSSSTYEVVSQAGSAVVRGTLFGVRVGLQGIRTCVNVIDEDDPTVDHSVAFTGKGVTKQVPEDMSLCCNAGGIPGSLFYTDPANDPLVNVGDGGGTSCPAECLVEGSCVCPCCCLPPCEWFYYGSTYIEGGGLPLLSIFQNILVATQNGYGGYCYCPEPTPTPLPDFAPPSPTAQ